MGGAESTVSSVLGFCVALSRTCHQSGTPACVEAEAQAGSPRATVTYVLGNIEAPKCKYAQASHL